MIVPLARKTLRHEWRRFLPAIVAVAFSGLLLLVTTALVLGIFGSAAVAIDRSGGDLWIGQPGTQSVELGRPIPPDTEIWLRLDPEVDRVEPFRWVDGDWRGGPDRGGVSISVSGIDPSPAGLVFARALPPALRARLEQPDSVIVDRADLDKLGVPVGGRARINGREVQVVGTAPGLRSLGGVNVLASLDTAERLVQPREPRVTYYLATLRDPARAEAVRDRLSAASAGRGYEVWTRADFARRAVLFWLLETGAGLGVLFLAGVVWLVGAIITSQTLMGAVAGSSAEYATLKALGIGVGALRRVVLEQAAWVGALGLAIGAAGTAGALWLAQRHDVPAALPAPAAAACAAAVIAIALVSGLAAVRALQHADPAALLR